MGRVAIYLGSSTPKAKRAQIRGYFRDAKRFGLRVVAVGQEENDNDAARPVRASLIARMEAGEFEAIMGIGERALSGAETLGRRKTASWCFAEGVRQVSGSAGIARLDCGHNRPRHHPVSAAGNVQEAVQ